MKPLAEDAPVDPSPCSLRTALGRSVSELVIRTGDYINAGAPLRGRAVRVQVPPRHRSTKPKWPDLLAAFAAS
jgi:hypothetical protein